MRAWLPERAVSGPVPAREADIEALNRLFAEAFTDRYRRDGLVGVRVPHLNPAVWRYALLDAGAGAMVWHDEDGRLAAFNLAHRCGVEGWMGPLAVRTDRQGTGVGKTIVRSASDWLIDQGVTTLGLETMPRTVENIGFYARLGFAPGHLTVTMTHEVAVRRRGQPAPQLVSRLAPGDHATALAGAGALVGALAPGYDFSRELLLTTELALGDTAVVMGSGDSMDAMVLWHSAPLAADRASEELRILKLAARNPAAFDAALAAAEASPAHAGLRRVA